MKTTQEVRNKMEELLTGLSAREPMSLLLDGAPGAIYFLTIEKMRVIADALHAFMAEDEPGEWPPKDFEKPFKDEIEEKAVVFTKNAFAKIYYASEHYKLGYARGVEAHMRHKEPGNLDRALRECTTRTVIDGQADAFTRKKLTPLLSGQDDSFIKGHKLGVKMHMWKVARKEAESEEGDLDRAIGGYKDMGSPGRMAREFIEKEHEGVDNLPPDAFLRGFFVGVERWLREAEAPEKLGGYYQVEVNRNDLAQALQGDVKASMIVHLARRGK